MSNKYYTTQEKTQEYDAVIGVFNELFKELKDLGKKKPEATLSASKVNLINRVLADAKEFLTGAPDHKYLDLLDSDSLPQYGDAILVLSQFEGALKSFRERHYGYQSGIGDAWYVRQKKK
ncbi:hypothetical protein SRABI05_04319 [Agrobacterium fabrum]|uniref:hypothetical protein n=1 Tax=Agrobacterium fabrum TaxID=1176649 RepID=UPI001D9216ED|nr:hypothetical protein [Agrobacterium fabrum]CAH0289801.1 hypothetical protein SRABI46_04290 [Agrobacterium fabrum]CAH0298476.1 hypothetical protein SRABI05_04319 [Agrobacterium fabrum]